MDNAVIGSQNSLKKELQQIQQEINQLKWQFFDLYLDTHMQLIEFSTRMGCRYQGNEQDLLETFKVEVCFTHTCYYF